MGVLTRPYALAPFLRLALIKVDIELIKRAVKIDLGISVVPSVTVKSEIQAGQLKAVALSEGPFMRPIAVLYRRGRSLPLGVRKFLDVLTGDTAPRSEFNSPKKSALISLGS